MERGRGRSGGRRGAVSCGSRTASRWPPTSPMRLICAIDRRPTYPLSEPPQPPRAVLLLPTSSLLSACPPARCLSVRLCAAALALLAPSQTAVCLSPPQPRPPQSPPPRRCPVGPAAACWSPLQRSMENYPKMWLARPPSRNQTQVGDADQAQKFTR